MNRIVLFISLMVLISGCNTWQVAPQPIPFQSPVPSATPVVVSPTPLIIPPPTFINEVEVTPALSWTASPPPTSTVTVEPVSGSTSQPTETSLAVEILGCNTSVDILHGMGEVTNAYVIVKNYTGAEMPNTCGLLRAIDEGREHPDKKVCVENLPPSSQVALKLTVDSTYQQSTIIQVDVLVDEIILLRVDKQSCRDINLFGGAPTDVGLVKPIP
ncbi:MAG: hypothetical protein KDD74_17975 [Anaerolineales bacterium]|nr:hypothetical protein [Anaerolineales bacterium]